MPGFEVVNERRKMEAILEKISINLVIILIKNRIQFKQIFLVSTSDKNVGRY